LLRRKTDDEPIFFGPIFLHAESDFETFSIFFSHLSVAFHKSDTTQLRLGSDDEKALRKAMRHAFPKAQLIACTRHLKENASRVLQDTVGCDAATRSEIIARIFGDNGLENVTDLDDFDRCVNELSAYFTQITSPDFVNYFENRLSTMLRSNLVGGLSGWTSNNVESMNHALKQAVNWQPRTLPDLVDKIHELVMSQIKDSRRAIIGHGNYYLRESHTRFRVTIESWGAMSAVERTNLVQKCFVLDPSSRSKHIVSTNGKLVVLAKQNAGKKLNQRKRRRCAKTTTPHKKSKQL